MLVSHFRPWRRLVPVFTSTRPRPLPRLLLPRLPIDAKRLSHHERLVKFSQASVLFESSRHATPANLIASIEPLSPSSIAGVEDSFEQAILLFTPSFAQPLAYDTQFLGKVLSRLFEKLPDAYTNDRAGLGRVSVAVAVVDRLPKPSHRRDHGVALNDGGSEGMSYVISAKKELNVANVPASAELDIDETKTLSLRTGNGPVAKAVTEKQFDHGKWPLGNSPSIEAVMSQNFEIRIPLASTVFQTGQSNMLLLSSWAWRMVESRYTLQQESMDSPSHVSFRYPFVHAPEVRIPLLPLTPPRRIVSGMGNVIRQIEGHTGDIAASHELEPAVNSYFNAKGLPPSAVNVWALMIPGNMEFTRNEHIWLRTGSVIGTTEPFHDEWQKESAISKFKWAALFRRGGRLYRVLSGGGGWGKKAGLISLDPDSDFIEASSAEPGAVFADDDLVETQQGMLGDAAKVGDLVQFYICPLNTPAHLPTIEHSGLRLEVGVIPSTIDTMPFAEESQDENEASSTGCVHDRLFGFMSEKGVSLAILEPGTDVPWITRSRTKISVPFARMLFTRTTKNMTFTSSEGKITPITDDQRPSETNGVSLLNEPNEMNSLNEPKKISPFGKPNGIGRLSKPNGIGPSKLTPQAITQNRAKVRKMKRVLNLIAPGAFNPENFQKRSLIARYPIIRKIPGMPVRKTLQWPMSPRNEPRVGASQRILPIRKTLQRLASSRNRGRVRANKGVPKRSLITRGRVFRKIPHAPIRRLSQWLASPQRYQEQGEMIPAEVKEDFARKLRLKFPRLNLRTNRHLTGLYFGGKLPRALEKELFHSVERSSMAPADLQSIQLPAESESQPIRKLPSLSTRERERLLKEEWRRRGKSTTSQSRMADTEAPWSLSQFRRRRRGKLGVKARDKFQEGLETAQSKERLRRKRAVEKHDSAWNRTWRKGGDSWGNVETAETEAQKKERQQKEEDEVLRQVRKLLTDL